MDNQLALLTLFGSIIALLFVASRAQKVLRFPEGSDRMKKISASIHQGAMAYLRRQYKILIGFFAIMFVILLVMAITGFLTPYVPFAFVTGGFFSGLSGFVGMQIATRANARTAAACQKSLNKGLNVAFSAGSVMGFTVVGLGLLDISIWYLLLKLVFKLSIEDITSTMLTFGMGASSMALFARVGGGIYTKAADVGADLVGKGEAGIPEDAPRHPAVISRRACIYAWFASCKKRRRYGSEYFAESAETGDKYKRGYYCSCCVSACMVYPWRTLHRILFCNSGRIAGRSADRILYRILYF